MIKHRRDLWQVVQRRGLKGSAAEIGVAEGLFAENILDMPCFFPKVYLVDRWACNASQKGDGGFPPEWHRKNLKEAQIRLARFKHRAVFLQGESHLMALRVPGLSLALLYIDGDHSYEGVTRDVTSWLPNVEPGGIVAFHDYENPDYGVKKAVTEIAQTLKVEIQLLPENRMEDAGAYFILP